MRRVATWAAMVALVWGFALAPTAAAAPPSYTSTVTVYCDGGTPGINVTGNFYRNYGSNYEKLLYLNGVRGFVFWGLTCPDGGTTPISMSWSTKWAPTHAVVGWTISGVCAVSALYTIPMDSVNPTPSSCSFSGRSIRVTISSAVQN